MCAKISLDELRNLAVANLARELSVGSSAEREIIRGLSMSLLIEPKSRENALARPEKRAQIVIFRTNSISAIQEFRENHFWIFL